ncbi:GMC oxidoreductase-like protein, partial [Apiospora sp. TS-2023a]
MGSFSTLLFTVVLHLVSHVSAIFEDNIMAQGLLGSHFGVPGMDGSYDYIVVGGGTAGLTIASRLAVNPAITVAVIEAGDFYEFSNGNLSQVPAFASYFTGNGPTLKNPFLDWYMYTTPQPQLSGRPALYDAGKIIGGSSGRNFLWQIRGTEGCFQKWADEVGDQGYTLGNLLPYFKRTYQYTTVDNAQRPPNSSAEVTTSEWDTAGGPVHVSYASWVNSISSWLRLSFEEIGIPALPSFYNGSLLGWSWLAVTLNPKTQTRSSSDEFLRESLQLSPNLIMYKSTLAKRILFENQTAHGVLVNSGGVEYTLTANREVVVSAGVMRSPQLLMTSGVGPKEKMAELGIDLIADRPGVGQNMWDNVLVGPTFAVGLTTHSSLSRPEFMAHAVEEFNTNHTGMLSNSGGDIAAFEKVPAGMVSQETAEALNDTFPPDWPHLEYLVLDAYFGTGSDSSPVASDGRQYVASSVGLVATFSRGNVTISSPDTAVNPVISPNWLLDPRDMEIAVAAFRRGRQLFNTSVMSPLVVEEVYPGANLTTDEEIRAIVRESANSVYNAAGTNKMGKANDALAVVDSNA